MLGVGVKIYICRILIRLSNCFAVQFSYRIKDAVNCSGE